MLKRVTMMITMIVLLQLVLPIVSPSGSSDNNSLNEKPVELKGSNICYSRRASKEFIGFQNYSMNNHNGGITEVTHINQKLSEEQQSSRECCSGYVRNGNECISESTKNTESYVNPMFWLKIVLALIILIFIVASILFGCVYAKKTQISTAKQEIRNNTNVNELVKLDCGPKNLNMKPNEIYNQVIPDNMNRNSSDFYQIYDEIKPQNSKEHRKCLGVDGYDHLNTFKPKNNLQQQYHRLNHKNYN